MAQRKLLSQQKSRLTTEAQVNKQATEVALQQLTKLSSEPPEWLDDTATNEWYRIFPLLEELPIASLDLALVSAYCTAYSDYINATIRMKNEDAIIVTERGTKLNQNHAIKRDALSQLNSIAPKLGLTIESRLKILDPSKEKTNEKSVFDIFGMDDDE
ncbi:phage terminase small subunit P27 family [Staphylococcus saprophyticus]|uniref:phage terminase small subunit P27 family n=1 Tax=Staphylococcus saprophyticus TaxID=29385 RepID=UPI00085290B8|nr:phage terminase small subunit P27 family [Staphylococcus saprophyticus]MDW4280219.1 phage terminase small subunit P27 family [Staphylococcus saprophyticus]MDW4294905.1 phage terminase small subunit P27 family [Staphylococcus saprophyticus]MDW4326668.1 phage terminase small subunit P27 family [Staphylococcus saprophyticus]MDW4346612.1 phage terminase small subunit P27 family [Staphylococcus saprophyticus]MDW4452839.1 phage terminase small subunit P27 family [Staphylococcus saprophyticus]